MESGIKGATVLLKATEGGMEVVGDRLQSALDMVDMMACCGLTAVPVKPSMDMLLAGARAGGVSVETAWTIYMAMLRAID